jgi:hypothetical protein
MGQNDRSPIHPELSMQRLLKWFSRPSARLDHRPSLEPLEDRWLPSATLPTPTDHADGSNLAAYANTPLPYWHGQVLEHARIVTVYYGDAWQTDPVLQQQSQQLDNFFATLTDSSYMDMLSEYNVGRGSYWMHVNVPLNQPTNADGTPGEVDVHGNDVQNMLLNAIADPNSPMPVPDANTLYMVFTAPNVRDPGEAPNVAGYHDPYDGAAGIHFGVVFYPGAVSNPGALNGLTVTGSHEMAEAVTDPNGDGWNNVGVAEVGDMAFSLPGDANGSFDGYQVQSLWSNAQMTRVLPPGATWDDPSVAGATSLTAARLQGVTDLSATVNQYGQPVVFALSARDHSLWENNPAFNAGGTEHWEQVSPAAFAKISAAPAANGQAPVVYGILAADHSLWENNPAFNPGAASPNGQWAEVSPGAFAAISATRGANGAPVVYGIVEGDRSLWENNPTFNPAGAPTAQWAQVSPGAFAAISATSANGTPVAYGIVAADRSLWENNAAFNPGAAPNGQWRQVSPGAFASLSATQFNGAPVVYGIVAADRSLWENTPAFNPGGALNGQWRQVSPGAFDSLSAAGAVVYAMPAADHSLWENNPAFNPGAGALNGQWRQLSGAAFGSISAASASAVYGTSPVDSSVSELDPAGTLGAQWFSLPGIT